MDTKLAFGELEQRILQVLSSSTLSVKQVQETLAQQGTELAYTTVMTVLTRLVQKGQLSRSKVSRAFVYSKTDDSNTFAGSVKTFFKRFFTEPSPHLVCHLLEDADDFTEADLQRIESLLASARAKKQEA